jgi:dipeptide/tripeptide permease
MITGMGLGTLGIGILAISTSPWIFITGIMVFTLGEMTAHPKFISYIGLIAPTDKKALYLGYSFLYGVIGCSIGGFLGSKLYVKYVDNLNQPRIMWLIFVGIGVVSMISLALYNRFIAKRN